MSLAEREDLRVFDERARDCQACPLAKTRTQVVIRRGSETPAVLLVGQSPGADEDREGVPFVGASGERLNQKIIEYGLGNFGVVNAAMCHPPGNRWDPDYALKCRPHLKAHLKLLQPKVVVAFGNDADLALRAAFPFLGDKAHPYVRIIHPSGIRSQDARVRWDREWRAAIELIRREAPEALP